jgi:hypothetical protein
MDELKEVHIDGEVVYLRKDVLGWHTVFPNKNKDGTRNWKNLIAGGSWIKLILIIGFVLICIGAIFEVSHIVKIANECLNPKLNISNINLNNITWNLK